MIFCSKGLQKDIEVKLPREINKSIRTFGSMTKAAQVSFIVALLESAIQIVPSVFVKCF